MAGENVPRSRVTPFGETVTVMAFSSNVNAMPRLLQSLGIQAVPKPGTPPVELPGCDTRVLPLSKTVIGPAPLFSIPASCWCENQGQGSLYEFINVKSPLGPMRQRIFPEPLPSR